MALETVVYFHFLSQQNFFQINCHSLVLSFALIFSDIFTKMVSITPFLIEIYQKVKVKLLHFCQNIICYILIKTPSKQNNLTFTFCSILIKTEYFDFHFLLYFNKSGVNRVNGVKTLFYYIAHSPYFIGISLLDPLNIS